MILPLGLRMPASLAFFLSFKYILPLGLGISCSLCRAFLPLTVVPVLSGSLDLSRRVTSQGGLLAGVARGHSLLRVLILGITITAAKSLPCFLFNLDLCSPLPDSPFQLLE